MKICIIGTGYVGLTAGACFSNLGHEVICIDIDSTKILNLSKGILPIYEPKLDELVRFNVLNKRLQFTTDIKNALQGSKVCFIAVGTPQNDDGSCDLNCVLSTANLIAEIINEYKVIVLKSTVPVGTTEKIREIIKNVTNIEFDVVANPEFLRQGEAVRDFLEPDRIIIGTDSKKAMKVMEEVYKPITPDFKKMIFMDFKSAEMTKYAANSFLATKISFINEIANLCEKTGANIKYVKEGMSADTRIGNKFFSSGIGYGGSCFPKDIKALINMSKKFDYDLNIISSVQKVNECQKKLFVDKILKKFNYNISGMTFAIWGLSFKPNTSDIREAPSVDVINMLLSYNAKINVFDPKAMDNIKKIFKNKINYYTDKYDSLKDSDGLLLLTEWSEFKNLDFDKIKLLLKRPIIFDARNLYQKEKLLKHKFEYFGIGT